MRLADLIYLPAYFVYKWLGTVEIHDEFLKWVSILKLNKGSEFKNFLWCFRHKLEYRSLLYLRLGGANRILRLLYQPLPTLSFEIESNKIGHGFILQHGYATIINAERVGENCMVWHNVTIGKDRPGGKKPIIGNNVSIFTGAVVIGDITVGDNSIIGANAVVTKSVPPNSVVVGIPAKVIKVDGVRVD